MKNSTKGLLILIALCLFAGLLAFVIHNSYYSKVDTIVDSVKESKICTVVVKDLDVSAQKYTAYVSFGAPQYEEKIASEIIESKIRYIMRDKNIKDVTNDDIMAFVDYFKSKGITIFSLMVKYDSTYQCYDNKNEI